MGELLEVQPALFFVAAFSRYPEALDWTRAWCGQWNSHMADVIEGQRTFTLREYHRMHEAGIFAPDEAP